MLDELVRPNRIAERVSVRQPPFVCSCTIDGPAGAWVHAAGELDLATAPRLDRALRAHALRMRLVVLDLRELAFMDGCGVHVIVNAAIRARRLGGRLIVLRGRPSIDRLFTLTGTVDEIEIRDFDSTELPSEVLRRLADEERRS